ncbi:ArsR family transcriptional regulator [Spirillospora sp. NPDC127200]
MVELLRKHGPSTAARLVERLGINSGATSYHLRRLGAADFVAEDTEWGNARERWWRSVHRTTRFEDLELAGHEATLAFLQSVSAERSRSGRPVPGPWRERFRHGPGRPESHEAELYLCGGPHRLRSLPSLTWSELRTGPKPC